MDNEEKKAKTTTTKKRTTTKKEETKKNEVKSKPVKKTTTKKDTTKKTTKPKTVKKTVEVKEVSQPKEEVKIQEKGSKVVTKDTKSAKVSKELLEIRRKRHLIEAIIIVVLAVIVIMLLANRTFLSINYKNDSINVSIPRFSYYVKDKDNKVKFVTLRKSKYLKEYYNEYLEGFIFYSCSEGENTFYYNEQTKTLIKEIKVEKHFAIKTIEISYDSRTPEEVCGLK